MPRLNELLRERTLPLRETLALYDDRLAQNERELASLNTRLQRFAEESPTARGELDRYRREQQELAQAISRLQAELQQKQERLKEVQVSLQSAEDKAGSLRRARGDADRRISQLNGDIERNSADKAKAGEHLVKAHAECFVGYLSELRADLLKSVTVQAATQDKFRALHAMESARHQDTEVASLLEAREEWRRIAQSARVPVVVGHARAELSRIEGALDERFPGALQAESGAVKAAEMVEDLYYAMDEHGSLTLFLPFDATAWNKLENAVCDAEVDLCLEIAWSARRILAVKWDDASFALSTRFRLLTLHGPALADIGEQSVEIRLGDRGKAEFVFYALPDAIREALYNENI